MESQPLFSFLASTAVFSDDDSDVRRIEHFGDIDAEVAALQTGAIVCPVDDLIRIHITGKDRAKFLHNFCTNNINELGVGQICEAFFTDVKAKILAHGYVASFEESIEVWMLPGDQESFLNHLNRYIITEDVEVTAYDLPFNTLAVLGPLATEIVAAVDPALSADKNSCRQSPSDRTALTTIWNDQPFVLICMSENATVDIWQALTIAGAVPSGQVVFEHARILERFPLVGTDVSNSNLAPEADRIEQAISYTKGCYLGQEPIARIDAMGHVNRKLMCCTAKPADDSNASSEGLPTVTSASQVSNENYPVLVMLKTSASKDSEGIPAFAPDGSLINLTCGFNE